MTIKYELVELENNFLKLKDAWEKLELRLNSPYPSASFQWCYLFWVNFKNIENNKIGFNKKLKIVCIYENDELILVAPLVQLQRKIGSLNITFLEFLGQQWGSIACNFLKHPNSSIDLSSLTKYFRSKIRYHVLFLRQISFNEDSFFENKLKPYSGAPFVNISKYKDFDSYKNEIYSKKLNQNLRTAKNKAEKNNFTISYSSESFNEIVFSDIKNISASKLISNKPSLYLDPCKADFFKSIFVNFTSNIVFVALNNKNVAYRANIIYNGIKFCIDASFDRNYKNYDLGALSVDLNLYNSFSKKLQKHNMGPGLDDYKLKFSDEIEHLAYYIESGKKLGSAIFTFLFNKKMKSKRII